MGEFDFFDHYACLVEVKDNHTLGMVKMECSA